MARQSRVCCASVLTASVALLEAAGYGLAQVRATDACAVCGCVMGEHVAALPGDTTVATLLDRTGWVECPACDVSCGTLVLGGSQR